MTDTPEIVATESSIAEYRPIEAGLAKARELYGATIVVVDTPERFDAAKKSRKEIRKLSTNLEAARKKVKAEVLERGKAIDSEAKRIAAEIGKIEEPYATAITEVENEKKREEEEKKRAEEERLTRCRNEIDRIHNVPLDLVGASYAAIAEAIARLQNLDVSSLDEFAGLAIAESTKTLATLNKMRDEAVAREAEQERITKEREELSALKAEQEARDRVEREKREAEERERRAALDAAEKESRDRIAEQERLAREAREKADAEARKAREAEEKRLAGERAKVEAEQRAIEADKRKAREAKEAKEREERKARESLMDGRATLQNFRQRYCGNEEFAVVVEAIDMYFDDLRVRGAA